MATTIASEPEKFTLMIENTTTASAHSTPAIRPAFTGARSTSRFSLSVGSRSSRSHLRTGRSRPMPHTKPISSATPR